MIKDNIMEVIHEMEEVTKLFKLEPLELIVDIGINYKILI